jgi:hypothetical protein
MKIMFNSCLLPRIFKQNASFLNAGLKKAIEEMCKAATPSGYFAINRVFKSANFTECKSCRSWRVYTESSREAFCNFVSLCSHSKPDFKVNIKTPWSESVSELCRPSDRRLLTKWLPTFAYRGCHVVSVTDPYGHILGFLGRSRYFSIK